MASAPPIRLRKNKPGRVLRGAVFAPIAVVIAGAGGVHLATVMLLGVWGALVLAWPQK